jgi:hypothetical protein
MLGVPRRFLRLSIRTMLFLMAGEPPIFYVILFRAIPEAILVVLIKINQAVNF